MAHELTITEGRAEMAYVGDVPWHGLGQALTADADIETWRREAGMDWTIRRAELLYKYERASEGVLVVPGQKLLHRSDTHEALGIVSAQYQVVQPGEVLEFFRDLVADQGFKLETAGTLFGGKRFWALARAAEGEVVPGDAVGGYLLLSSSADGSTATTAMPTTVRVVCNNTLSMALSGNVSSRVIRVSHRQRFDADRLKDEMGLVREGFTEFLDAARVLSKVRVGASRAEALVTSLLGGDNESKRKPRGLDIILGLFEGAGMGSSLHGSAGTAWGLLNAVTEYVDHHATATTTDHRLDRAWFGSGADMKLRLADNLLSWA